MSGADVHAQDSSTRRRYTAAGAVSLHLISPKTAVKSESQGPAYVVNHLLKSGMNETTVDEDGKTAVGAATRRISSACS